MRDIFEPSPDPDNIGVVPQEELLERQARAILESPYNLETCVDDDLFLDYRHLGTTSTTEGTQRTTSYEAALLALVDLLYS